MSAIVTPGPQHHLKELFKTTVAAFFIVVILRVTLGGSLADWAIIPFFLILWRVVALYLNEEERIAAHWIKELFLVLGTAAFFFTVRFYIGQIFSFYFADTFDDWGKEWGAIGMFWARHQVSSDIMLDIPLFVIIAYASFGLLQKRRLMPKLVAGALALFCIFGYVFRGPVRRGAMEINAFNDSVEKNGLGQTVVSYMPSLPTDRMQAQSIPSLSEQPTVRPDFNASAYCTGELANGTDESHPKFLTNGFSIQLHPGCFTGFTQVPGAWFGESWYVELVPGQPANCWFALKFPPPHDQTMGAYEGTQVFTQQNLLGEQTMEVRTQGGEGCWLYLTVKDPSVVPAPNMASLNAAIGGNGPTESAEETPAEMPAAQTPHMHATPVAVVDEGNFHVTLNHCERWFSTQVKCFGKMEDEKDTYLALAAFEVRDAEAATRYMVSAGNLDGSPWFAKGPFYRPLTRGLPVAFSFTIDGVGETARELNIAIPNNQAGDGSGTTNLIFKNVSIDN